MPVSMNPQQLQQVSIGSQSSQFELVTEHKAADGAYADDEARFQEKLLTVCPEELWFHDSHKLGSPWPILLSKYHQKRLQDIHKALTAAIVDIVDRWWKDDSAKFPERMPLEGPEEDLLRWMDGQVHRGHLRKFSACLGTWRPDFLVEDDEKGRESFTITEINARFIFNGYMHQVYGQQAVNDSLDGTGLLGATNPQKMLDSLFGLFQPSLPLHIVKGREEGIDIHMFVEAVWSRLGIRPRFITPSDLRLVPDAQSSTGFRLCCLAAAAGSQTFVTEQGELVEEVLQAGLELKQPELAALPLQVARQLSLCCFNDLRTILLVHDKRMLGIIKDEIPQLVARNVLTQTQGEVLDTSVVDTILPGSARLKQLLHACRADAQLRNEYLLKPIRSGKGNGIVFGDENSAAKWISALERQQSAVGAGGACVVQRRIYPHLYNMVLKASAAMVRYPLVGTFHIVNGTLVGLGIWRTNKGKVIAVSSGGSWLCSVVRQG